MTEMFRTDAYNRTPTDVTAEFARTYWEKPRQVINLRQVFTGDDTDLAYFEIEDGIRD